MSKQTPLLVTTMVFAFFALFLLGILIAKPTPCAAESECADGKVCPTPWVCCDSGCCAPVSSPSRSDPDEPLKEHGYSDPWYTQWPILFLLGTLGGILICCMWCLFCKRSSSQRVYMCSLACCVRRPTSNHDSAGSVYPPPRYSRCGSFHQAPPPYSEVTSKPDLYPLVITYNAEGDAKTGGSYLMVHYFRNYVIAPGSLSATSTAESLNSSFICNASNEANSIIPPPYSCASNYEDTVGRGCGRSLLRSLSSLTEPRPPAAAPRARTAPDIAPIAPSTHRTRDSATTFRENLMTSPVQPLDTSFDLELELIDCEMYCDGGCKPRLGQSPPTHRPPSNVDDDTVYDPEAFGLRHLFTCPSPEGAGTCESPPQPTSPTQTSTESTLRRPSDERRHRRRDNVKKSSKGRKSSLYMPLVTHPVRNTRISPGARTSSRSAPATPCSNLVPNLLNFTQRVSASRHSSRSSRLEEESNPLISEAEYSHTDHKF
ncbi:uncharacterized protein LOC131840999 [Achroia grisella]|uniref:uncharacterized protein LOC131840999 n=1 Tax=Achroia grisella TaxID=688607 RepID=UPI0027D2230A|nr:uncharacterized protein LOC131840999 [Achroia grisella]